MNYQLLDWDSQFFGFKVAKIISSRLEAGAVGEVLEQLRLEGVSLVYWASDSEDAASQGAAEKFSGFLADQKMTYTIDLSSMGTGSRGHRVEIEAYKAADPIDELENLALISGQYSRFKIDPRVPIRKFEELYRLWLTRSIQGLLAEKVLIFHGGTKAAGMVTLKQRDGVGQIGLLGVHPEFSGRGVGTSLVMAAQSWFSEAGCRNGRVVTQGKNELAKRLYEKCGYVVEKIENYYHFWLRENL